MAENTTSDNQSKKQRLVKKIGTHDGTFHCDEALACYMLRLTSEFKDAEIIRSRDTAILKTLDCLVDVGSEYDHSKYHYDHHQRGFTGTLDENHDIKLSSAGLIYKHYGREVISNIIQSTDDKLINTVYYFVYENFIESIDGIDNGISLVEGVKPRYKSTTDISSRVKYLNPAWNDPDTKPDVQFRKAVELVGTEFVDRVNYCVKHWLPAHQIVKQAVDERKKHRSEGDIIVLQQPCPWGSHLSELEEEYKITGLIKYVLFPSEPTWRIQCVPTNEGGFENRLPLPEPWQGKRDKELSEVVGIEGCIFAHHNGFIGGHQTFEGVLQMANKSLAYHNNKSH
jgi:uncharacterized UPF0160 family protein